MANNTSITTALRNATLQLYVTAAGATGGKLKRYNGVKPATTSTALSGNTLLETFSFPTTPVGTVASGVITLNVGAATCVNTNNVNGTATWSEITDSADVVVLRSDQFTSNGTVVNGITTTLSGLTIVEGNP